MAFPGILKKVHLIKMLQVDYSRLDQSASTKKPDSPNAPAPAESINFFKVWHEKYTCAPMWEPLLLNKDFYRALLLDCFR